MNLTASIRCRSTVDSDNNFNIIAWASGELPEIYKAEILADKKTVDNTEGEQGDLLISLDSKAGASINSVGNLLLKVSDTEADKYYRQDSNLFYESTGNPVLNNELRNIGDSLLVNITAYISGRIKFSDFVLDITGEQSDNGVVKLFRISTDDLFWTDWAELTVSNIAAIEDITAENSVTIELQFIKQSGEGTLYFNSIEFNGSLQSIEFVVPTIEESIFSKVFFSEETKRIEQNLFKKLYYRGVMAQYVTRGANRDYNEDKDYVSLFSTVGRFFGMMISFAKQFENIYDNFDMLREYVRQIGLYFDEKNVTLEELQYLASHYYDEIRKRGTGMIFSRRGVGDNLYNGEFVRLFCLEDSDELLTENTPNHKIGWCLGQSSPLYKGTGNSNQLNKTREYSPDFESIDDFVTNGNVVIEETADKYITGYNPDGSPVYQNKKCLKVTQNGGLGLTDGNPTPEDKLYNADCNLSYEVTFWLKTNGSGKLLFGVDGFNSFKNKLGNCFISLDSTKATGNFVDDLDLSKLRPDTWYFVRGILHAYYTAPIKNSAGINIMPDTGDQLCYNNYGVRYILPKIILSGSEDSILYIWNYKIRPLVYGKNILPLRDTGIVKSYSNGFIQSYKLFYIFLRNNNNTMSQQELERIVNKYLIPYGYNPVFVYGTVPVNPFTTPSEFVPYLTLSANTIMLNHSGELGKVRMSSNTNVIKIE